MPLFFKAAWTILTSRLGIIGVAVFLLAAGFGWHKHVVHQRDTLTVSLATMTKDRDAWKDAQARSEKFRASEAADAKIALQHASEAADARVAEARRSAHSIRTIVEKSHAKLDPHGCPVPELVTNGELRDALQPPQYGPYAPPAAEPGAVRSPAEGASPAALGRDPTSFDAGRPGGDGRLSKLGERSGAVGPWACVHTDPGILQSCLPLEEPLAGLEPDQFGSNAFGGPVVLEAAARLGVEQDQEPGGGMSHVA